MAALPPRSATTAPIRSRRLPMVITALSATVLAAAPTAQAQEPFPHADHERLFPLCSGCHDVGTGQPDDLYPSADLCGRCHDGEQVREVRWSRPTTTSSYEHPEHEDVAGVALACQDCHQGGRVVAVTDLAASCASCHDQHHSASARCRSCHAASLRARHDVRAHEGCAGAQCHAPDRVADLAFSRELCLLCHRDMDDHKPGQDCGRCHAVGQPGQQPGR